MEAARRITGWGALVSYLVVGALLYLTVLPSLNDVWPPDFYLRGYGAVDMALFWADLSAEARQTYSDILLRWDRIFVVTVAVWLTLTGWRGGWMRFAVAALALLYAAIDLTENIVIHQFISAPVWDPTFVDLGSHLTMAKFASAYLCVLVLIVRLRRLP